MMSRYFQGLYRVRVPFLILGLLTSLFILLPTIYNTVLENNNSISILPNIRPNIQVYQQGKIEYADVTLDGRLLFTVTSPISSDKGETNSSTLRLRIESIESNLYQLVQKPRDPNHLYIGTALLDRQTVILAKNQSQSYQKILLTVTELDAQLAQQTIPALAQEWSDLIHQSLRQAWEDRSPFARSQQAFQAAKISSIVIIIHILLSAVKKWIDKIFKHRKQQIDHNLQVDNPTASVTEIIHDFEQTFDQQQGQSLYIWLRKLLRLAKLAIWAYGINLCLLIFPETHLWGKTLIAFIMRLIIIVFLMLLLAQILNFLLNKSLKNWVEETSLEVNEVQRVALRAPTLAGVLEGIINYMSWLIGLILLINWQQTPIQAILTNISLLGVAIGIVFQNLLRDLVNGMFIIFGDQYAVGDTVNISGINGVVENMNMRSTNIRGAGGSLNIIPHGQITTVQNLTKDWSRVDLIIPITKDTDIKQAMVVMQQVAYEMSRDPDWQTRILEPISRIGVISMAATGTQILIWIKTTRTAQWIVEHEFRYRLKLAFDAQGISIS